MRSVALSVLVASFAFAPLPDVEAQIPNVPSGPSRIQIGADFVVSQPKGELASNIGNGYGLNGTGMFRLDPQGFLSLRADIGTVQYGSETQHIPFLPISGRVNMELETTNNISWGSIGAQLQIPNGWFRPYANAAIAYTDFSTQSTLSDESFEYASRKNQGDGSRAWVFGGGVVIPFGSRYSLSGINLGARYYYGGTAEYLREGDIIDNPDGTITLTPRRSKTDLVLWQLGISYVIPRWTAQ